MNSLEINIVLPQWLGSFCQASEKDFPAMTDRMGFVIEMARQNVQQKTGGPFAAAVFDQDGGLVAPGVNLVISTNCSILHAEMVAIALAQKSLGRYDIGDGGRSYFSLYTACEPCAMCFGAVHWSGVRQLVYGAREEDARAIGFDEGPKLINWALALNNRGIEVEGDVMRKEAVAVLRSYKASGGIIYNPG